MAQSTPLYRTRSNTVDPEALTMTTPTIRAQQRMSQSAQYRPLRPTRFGRTCDGTQSNRWTFAANVRRCNVPAGRLSIWPYDEGSPIAVCILVSIIYILGKNGKRSYIYQRREEDCIPEIQYGQPFVDLVDYYVIIRANVFRLHRQVGHNEWAD